MKPKFKLLKLLNIAEMYIIDLEHYEKIRQTMHMISCIQLYLLAYQKNIDEDIIAKILFNRSLNVNIKFSSPIQSI